MQTTYCQLRSGFRMPQRSTMQTGIAGNFHLSVCRSIKPRLIKRMGSALDQWPSGQREVRLANVEPKVQGYYNGAP